MEPRCYVFFDMDDTLIEWTVSWRNTFVEAAAEAGLSVTADQAFATLSEAFGSFYRDCIREHAGLRDDRAFWLAYDRRVLQRLGVTEGLDRAAERVVERLSHPGARRLYPEVAEVLAALAASGVRLGIVTGRPLAEPDLTALGIRDYFHPLIDAFTAGSAKSEGRMFHLASRAAAGLPAWHVGDSHADDVLGAQAAGLHPILIDRQGTQEVVGCRRIGDLRELPGIVLEA